MEITHPNHKSGQGIYGKSRRVTSKEDWAEAKTIGEEMVAWLAERNGSFKGSFSRAFAIAHAQVCDWLEPWQMFVVADNLVATKEAPEGRENLVNALFEAPIIFNAEVLEAPDKVTRKVPKRVVHRDEKDPTKVEVSVELEEKEVENVIRVPEGCMSFPFRSEKNTQRFYRIKVRYQYIRHRKLLGDKVETFEGWVEGLKAHILQHETDHFKAKNIFFS